jgi:hypothetical protein
VAEWCCAWLDELLTHAGEKGMAVVASCDGDRRRFCLQARSVERTVAEELGHGLTLRLVDSATGAVATGGGRVGIALTVNIPIRHCPSCGADLRAVVDGRRERFDELAAKMSRWTSGQQIADPDSGL